MNNQDSVLYVIRHAEWVDLEDKNLYSVQKSQGVSPTDTHLTSWGVEMAIQSGQYLKKELSEKHPTKKNYMIISSPYLRCIQTSLGIIEGLGDTQNIYGGKLFIESGFEECFSEFAMVRESTRKDLMYHKFENDLTLKNSIFKGIPYETDTLLNYSSEVAP